MTTLETLKKTTNLEEKIKDILSRKFIYTDGIAEILASAIYSGQNVILYGPGGHGKSEMVEAVLEGLGLWDRADPINSQTLIQSFGEGLTEDALWGGIDFKRLNSPTDPDMVFNVENSFLKYPVAVFEELFDAPAFCLLPLKHTIQAGFLAKSGRSYPMNTKLIIACTNRDPADIEEMGETYRALLERFVLRQEVAWPSYTADKYAALLRTHKGLVMASASRDILCQLMADCQATGHLISPRTAMKAVDILIGAAHARGATEVIMADLAALKHVAGFQQVAIKFADTIEQKQAEVVAREALQVCVDKLTKMSDKLSSGTITRVVEYLIMAKSFLTIQDEFNAVRVPDSLYQQRAAYIKQAADNFVYARDKAVELTRI
jgi:hypothetical protein